MRRNVDAIALFCIVLVMLAVQHLRLPCSSVASVPRVAVPAIDLTAR